MILFKIPFTTLRAHVSASGAGVRLTLTREVPLGPRTWGASIVREIALRFPGRDRPSGTIPPPKIEGKEFL